MMKTCTKCGIEKIEDEFSFKNKRAGTRQSKCKSCYSGIMKSHYENNKQASRDRKQQSCQRRLEYLRELKGTTPCHDCHVQYKHYIMEFDHREGKELCVTSAISWSWKKMLSEVVKCDVVCSNCHSERTWQRKTAGG